MENLSAPKGAVIGLIGEDVPAIEQFSQTVTGPVATCRYAYTLDRLDAYSRGVALMELEQNRRSGATVLVASNDEQLLARLADEVWWIDGGSVAQKGDPSVVIASYTKSVVGRLRAYAMSKQQSLASSMRRGDGRASILSLETLDSQGQPALVWMAGQDVAIRVTVQYASAVDDPVVGIMIRTRIGTEAFGTNTELEGVKLGPCAPSDKRVITFSFRCELCPREYSVTAASHDPDGVWHDWMEDAVAFTVADTRYTAGVANLHAKVSVNNG